MSTPDLNNKPLGAPSSTNVWPLRLYDSGLRPLPGCWGGGLLPKGANGRELSDNPPTREAVEHGDFGGGNRVILGTEYPVGGYTLGLDPDKTPLTTFPRPADTVYMEAGTRPGSFHLILVSFDRFDGRLSLKSRAGQIVAEVFGRGYSLRCYPSMPLDKARGYRPLFLAQPDHLPTPHLTSQKIIEAVADYLSRALGEDVLLDHQATSTRPATMSYNGKAPDWLGLVFNTLVDYLVAHDCGPRPQGNGGVLALCPLHRDRRPSLTLHPIKGWKCWGGCGEGRLMALAYRLGITFKEQSNA